MNPDMAKSQTEAAYDLGYEDGRKAEQDDFMLRSGLGQLCNQIYQLESTIEHAGRGIMAAMYATSASQACLRMLAERISPTAFADEMWAKTKTTQPPNEVA